MSDIDPLKSSEAIAEQALQQELRSLFAVDTQSYLQQYSQTARQLEVHSWVTQIQELYRFIHTIKGGAVTVAANAVLSVSAALEDLLSDLRYLDPPPPLADGHLHQILFEAGELLTVTLDLEGVSSESVEPIVSRMQTLHNQVRTQYLPTWDENQRLHQEFAEQGFDLVVLDLEIALERLPATGEMPKPTIEIGQRTLNQLQQIGQDIQLTDGWVALLDQAQALLKYPQIKIWQSQWPLLAQAFKDCAKRGGEAVPFKLTVADHAPPDLMAAAKRVPEELSFAESEPPDFLEPDALTLPEELNFAESVPPNVLQPDAVALDTEVSQDVLADSRVAPDFEPAEAFPEELNFAEVATDTPMSWETVPDFEPVEAFPEELNFAEVATDTPVSWAEDKEFFEELNASEELPTEELPPKTPNNGTASNGTALQLEMSKDTLKPVQIPVPLERLDQSAQYLVDTLLSARATQNFHQTLQKQIAQLVNLAREGEQYITRLRQIQDDYALLDHLRNTPQGPTPERYRQGYTAINRLLESSLRLSEVGAEAEKVSQQTATSLQDLGRNLLRLQGVVEDSRLVPFQNLGFRARAILRDLITRYGKPAQFVIQGEQLELDVNTARSLEPVLLHLIRNAYDHGLESRDQRISQGKSEKGTLTLTLKRRGDIFLLSLSDNGRGITTQAIQNRAEQLGLPLTQIQSSDDLLAVICQPGFSSETQVSDLSGRGVGMDVITNQVAQLGGQLSLETTPGAGTTFSIQFSVPYLFIPCILVRSGSRVFAIPTEEVKTTALVEALQITHQEATNVTHTWRVQDETGIAPALNLLDYWQTGSSANAFAETAVGIYVEAQERQQGAWLFADDLIEQSDLLISPLPPPLIAPDGLMGVSLQPDGLLVPVLDAPTLVEKLFQETPQETEAAIAPPPDSDDVDRQTLEALTQTILIVDDAALMRRRIEASLTTHGYVTHTCADGLEAWNWLQANLSPRLVITDIEMPNMDGFTLIERCRQAGMTVPILVISSRLSEEWFNEAKRLGATDYLTKGFSTPELISKLGNLLEAV
ncbi:MAG: response regulator [Cyanobacteria bacterium J06635_15]